MNILGSRQAPHTENYLPVDAYAREITRKGARDGVRGVDKLASPTQTEEELAARYGAVADIEANSAQSVVGRGIDGARRRTPVPAESDIASIRARCAAKLKALGTGIRAEMGERWNNVVAARAQLDQFKINAGINGDARYPESKVSHFGSLYLIGLGEAMANSWFYGSASPDGLGAGLLQAAIISAVLIGSAAMAGCFALRSCFSPNRVRSGFGFAGMGIYAAFGLFISLAAASFRDALANDAELTGLMLPIREILVNPTQLSFEAITLLAFALMASALALYKGFTSDAPVPGHGALDRDYRQAVDSYNKVWMSATSRVTREREEAEHRLEDIVNAARKDLEQRERQLADAHSAMSAYDMTRSLLTSGYDYAVKMYRDSANVIQPDTPWPAARALNVRTLQSTGIERVESELQADRERLDGVQLLAAETGDALNDVAADVQSALEEYRANLEATHAPGVPTDSPRLKVVAEPAR